MVVFPALVELTVSHRKGHSTITLEAPCAMRERMVACQLKKKQNLVTIRNYENISICIQHYGLTGNMYILIHQYFDARKSLFLGSQFVEWSFLFLFFSLINHFL